MTLHAVPSETRYITREQLAERMGCSVRTVDRMKADGMPYVTWGRRLTRYDPNKAIPWAIEYGDKRRDAA
jgi:phage terminase Nu1 subunit (DNA packaging protein)